MVLDIIRRLADQGVGVLLVSHNLNDVFAVADRFAILHLGRMAASGPAGDFDRQVVVDYMTTGTTERASAPGAPKGPEGSAR
jgi:ABC-type sugar transport system ATPase subunit